LLLLWLNTGHDWRYQRVLLADWLLVTFLLALNLGAGLVAGFSLAWKVGFWAHLRIFFVVWLNFPH
jgi:hypothetical protein